MKPLERHKLQTGEAEKMEQKKEKGHLCGPSAHYLSSVCFLVPRRPYISSAGKTEVPGDTLFSP